MAGSVAGPDRYVWTIEKIEKRGIQDGDCIIYNGNSLHRQGYPMMRFEGKMRTVSSVIIQLKSKYGTVPGRKSKDKITRTCGNIKCINSEHTVVMSSSNIMKNAHQTGFTTQLNADQVREIRKEYNSLVLKDKDGRVRRRKDNGQTIHRCGSQNVLAKKYGVNSRLIWNVVRGRLYKWVK